MSAEEAQAAAASKGFCGKLVYHQGLDDLEQTSPPDQHLPSDKISKFDVVRGDYVGAASLSYCYVFCDFIPTGETTFDAVHTVGSAAGITDNPDDADRKDGDRFFTTSYALTFSSASALVEANADTWRMNGWANPQALETFAGFIEDGNGNPVDDDRLQELYTEESKESSFPAGTTRGTLCGYTPDGQISINAADQGICEIDFSYVSDGEDLQDDGDFKEGYNNEPCKSPTYVCGAANEYWQATLVCTAGNSVVLTDPCTDSNGPSDPTYTRFHWVVAPTQSVCTGQQEPGFVTKDTAADLPYMAHDLDVYVPPTSVNGIDATQGVSNTQDYAISAQNEQTPVDTNPRTAAFSAADRVTSANLPDLPSTPADELIEGQDNRVAKQHLVEPNARTPPGLSESSQTQSAEPSPLEGGLCSPFNDQVETEETHDDWVNLIDMNGVVRGTTATGGLTGFGAYNNTAERQDDTNTNGPTPFYTIGQLGMFRDANDNGQYDQVGNANLFSNIQSVGAYPMFWDMRVNENGEISQDSGCQFGFGDERLPGLMETAGYGPTTGLVQAIYLKEPTVANVNDQVVEFPDGNNIFLIESQSIHTLREQGNSDVTDFLDEIVDGIKTLDEVPDEGVDTVHLADTFDQNTLFDNQCAEDTGGFSTKVNLVHDCSLDCSGDTIVTGYLAELTDDQNRIGSQDGQIPYFTPDGETPYSFETTEGDLIKWTDVDPFDSNPERQDDTDSSPPT